MTGRPLYALCGALLTACATGPGSPPPPPPATTLIAFAQAFDSGVASCADLSGAVAFVWSDNKRCGSVPGVITGQYWPAYRLPAAAVAAHPDWVMYKADQKTVAYEFGNTAYPPVDITNPAVVAYIEGAITAAMIPGQTWLDLDNVDAENSAGFAGHFDAAGAWVAQYTGQPKDPAWLAANVAYLAALKADLARPTMINDSANSAYITASSVEQLAATATGSAMEGWPIDGCYSDSHWANGRPFGAQFDLEYQEMVADAVAPTISLSYLCGHGLADATPGELAWITVARLLTVRGATGNYVIAGGAEPLRDIDGIEAYPASMNPAIGPITDPPPAPGGRPYVRRFAHGVVALNPTSGPLSTTIPAGVDQFGNPIPAGPYTLAPMSAVVVVTP